MDAATDLLEIKLREKLREDLGETYSIGVGYQSLQPYRRFARMSVSWGSAPDTRDQMIQIVKDTMKSMRTSVPSEADVSKLRELRYNSLDESVKENGYWLGSLVNCYVLNREPKTILDYRKRIDRLSVTSLRAAIRKWFDQGTSLEVFLLPEEPLTAESRG